MTAYVVVYPGGRFTMDEDLFFSPEEALGATLLRIDGIQKMADGQARYKLLPPKRLSDGAVLVEAVPDFAGGYPEPKATEALILPVTIPAEMEGRL